MHPSLLIVKENIGNNRNLGLVLSKLNAKRFVEVGVFAGANFRNMIQSNFDQGVAVDLWKSETDDIKTPQETMDAFYQSLLQLSQENHKVTVHRMSSEEASKLYSDNHFDFVYLDANHTYDGVKSDIQFWYPKVKRNGIISGHDYKTKRIRPGVICEVPRAVNEFVQEYSLELYISPERCPSWYAVKK